MNKRSWRRWLDSFSDNPKSKIENPKWVGILAIVLTVAFGGAVAEAQQPKKVHRIGYLVGGDVAPERFEAIRLALRELGYIEGQNIAIEYRYAEGKRDRSVRSRAKIWSSHSTPPRNLSLGVAR